jgi:hypothetical protein
MFCFLPSVLFFLILLWFGSSKKYIQILEDLMETNVSIVSTGPDRKETIDINGTLSNI